LLSNVEFIRFFDIYFVDYTFGMSRNSGFFLKPANQRWYNGSMSLTEEEVKHIAHLARLELSDAELESYREQLSAILEYADRLKKVDTSGIPPTSSVLPPHTFLREDIPHPGLSTAEALQNASCEEQNQFRVPPVLDET
jgi:aspartyl-tRNA(Asn)/glutamyl-tRNA(Gln) amidotransferase subunit C